MKTKFSNTIMFITIGFYLMFIKINFFNLNYILPFIGYMLLIYNFSKLKDLNQYFKFDYYISIYFFVVSIISLFVFLNNWVFYIIQFVIQIAYYHFYIKGIYASDTHNILSEALLHNHMIGLYFVAFFMVLSILNSFFVITIAVVIMYVMLFQNIYYTASKLDVDL